MKSAKAENLLFLIIVTAILLDRFLLLQIFGFRFTDNDQMLFWQGATDYAQGIFHEPYFYGQDYNFMFEALLATPLLWLGLEVYYALPIITNLLCLLPYLVIALALKKRGFFNSAVIFLAIPLLMPVDYSILTSLSRGFVSGLAVVGFLVFAWLKPSKISSYLIFGSISALALILNPNAALFCFPVGIYLLLINFRKWKFYVYTLLAAAPFLLIQYFSKKFYEINPEYKVHGMWDLKYSWNDMIDNLAKLDKMMDYVSPVFWFWGWSVLVVLGVLVYPLFKRSKIKAVSIGTGLILILFTLGINKVQDYYNTIFFSGSRMYLALPLLFGLALHWLLENYTVDRKWFIPLITGLCIMAFCVKAEINSLVVHHHTQNAESQRLSRSISTLKKDCSHFRDLIKQHNPDIIIFIPDWRRGVPYMEFYNYGCPLLEEEFSPTLLNIYERRTWLFQNERNNINKTVMLFGGVNFDQLKYLSNAEVITTDPDLVVLRKNMFDTESLMDTLHLDYLRARY